MGRNNRARRVMKQQNRARKRKARKKKRDSKVFHKNTSGLVFHMVESPLANFSDEERAQFFERMGKNSEKISQESLAKLQNILRKYHVLTLLSIFSTYRLSTGLGDDGVKFDAHYNFVSQPHVEICQAWALQVNKEELGWIPVTPDIVKEAEDALVDLVNYFGLKRM